MKNKSPVSVRGGAALSGPREILVITCRDGSAPTRVELASGSIKIIRRLAKNAGVSASKWFNDAMQRHIEQRRNLAALPVSAGAEVRHA